MNGTERAWKAATAILVKDARIFARRRGLLAIVFLYPVLTVAILAFAFVAEDPRPPVAFVNLDRDRIVWQVGGENVSLDTLRDQLGLAVRLQDARSPAEGEELLRRGAVDAVLTIPPHFLLEVSSLNRTTNVTVLLDPADPIRSQVAESVLRGTAQAFIEQFIRYKMETILARLRLGLEGASDLPGLGDVRGFRQVALDLEGIAGSANLTAEQLAAAQADIRFLRLAIQALEESSSYLQATALPVGIEQRSIAAETLRPTDLLAPLAIGLSVVWTGSLAGAATVGIERQRGLLPRLLQSPAHPASIVAGKLALAVALVSAQSGLLLAIAVLLGVPGAGIVPAFATILFATVALSGIGMLVASISPGLPEAVLLTAFLAFPMFLVSGILFPVSYMPQPFQAIASMLPSTVAVDALRSALLRGSDVAALTPSLLALLGAGAGALAIATATLSRRT